MQPAVYIMASKRNGTLYVGVTSNLERRAWEHRSGTLGEFTHRYGCHTLVWYELHERMLSAIQREKQLKRWNRSWKLRIIEAMNPDWRDLDEGAGPPPTRG